MGKLILNALTDGCFVFYIDGKQAFSIQNNSPKAIEINDDCILTAIKTLGTAYTDFSNQIKISKHKITEVTCTYSNNTALENNAPVLSIVSENSEDIKGQRYSIEGARGKHIYVYEDRAVIQTKTTVRGITTIATNKTVYYADCASVQFKPTGKTLGYIQLETPDTIMNTRSNNFFSENSFTFCETKQTDNKFIQEVVAYIEEQIKNIKILQNAAAANNSSAAD